MVEEEKCLGFGRQCLGFDHDFSHLSGSLCLKIISLKFFDRKAI
jgi:hypothetical protein